MFLSKFVEKRIKKAHPDGCAYDSMVENNFRICQELTEYQNDHRLYNLLLNY